MQKVTTRCQTYLCGAPHVSEHDPLLGAPEMCMCASCNDSSARTPLGGMPETSPRAFLSLSCAKQRPQKTIQHAEEHQLHPQHKPSSDRLMLFALPRPLQNIVLWHDSVMHNMGVCDGVWMCLDRHQTLNPVQQHTTRRAGPGATVWY